MFPESRKLGFRHYVFPKTQVLRRHRSIARGSGLLRSPPLRSRYSLTKFRQPGMRRPPSSFYIIWASTGGQMGPIWRLLVRPERLSQRFGERSEDPDRWVGAGDVVVRCVCYGRLVSRAVARGYVAIDLHHHRSVKPGMVVDGSVEPG